MLSNLDRGINPGIKILPKKLLLFYVVYLVVVDLMESRNKVAHQ